MQKDDRQAFLATAVVHVDGARGTGHALLAAERLGGLLGTEARAAHQRRDGQHRPCIDPAHDVPPPTKRSG